MPSSPRRARNLPERGRAVDVVARVLLARPGHLDRAAGGLLGQQRGEHAKNPPRRAGRSRRRATSCARWSCPVRRRRGPRRASRAIVGNWFGAQMSSTPSFSRAVAFIGSMQRMREDTAPNIRPRPAFRAAHRQRRCRRRRRRAAPSRRRDASVSCSALEIAGTVERIVGRAPFDLDRVGRLERRPGVFGDDAEAVAVGRLDRHDLDDARHLLGLREIGLHRLRPEARAHLHRAVEHVGQRHIDAEDRRAGDLGQHVDALLRLAEQLPVGLVLEPHVGRHVELGGIDRDLAIGHATCPTALCSDRAVFGRRARRPERRASRAAAAISICARRRARLAHLDEAVARRGRAAGALQAEDLADARPSAPRTVSATTPSL